MYENFSFPPALIAVWCVIFLIVIIAWWKIFEKAGQAGWKSIIPFYNIYILLKIVGKPGWWLILIIFLPFIFGIWTYNMLSKSFGKDEAFTVGLIFLGFIFLPVLGFGSAKYLGPYGDKTAFESHNLKDYKFGKE